MLAVKKFSVIQPVPPEPWRKRKAVEGADFDALFALNALSGVDGDPFFLFANFNSVSGADFRAHAAAGAFFFVVVGSG